MLGQALSRYLSSTPPGETVGGRYSLTLFHSVDKFVGFIQQDVNHVDCLILEECPELPSLFSELQQYALYFPAVIVQSESTETEGEISIDANTDTDTDINTDAAGASTSEAVIAVFYHTAALRLPAHQISQIGFAIDQAISRFIQFSPSAQTPDIIPVTASELPIGSQRALSLKTQQLRLAEKLKERLGYLGVYYKRNPQNFLRHMNQFQREEVLKQLKEEYREIILTYFSDELGLNQKLDGFVNDAFFADVPVSQIVEIHMELMDEFSKHLKLEGRSDEILQDYRLTLIDTIAHLCEMYRRSIPRDT